MSSEEEFIYDNDGKWNTLDGEKYCLIEPSELFIAESNRIENAITQAKNERQQQEYEAEQILFANMLALNLPLVIQNNRDVIVTLLGE